MVLRRGSGQRPVAYVYANVRGVLVSYRPEQIVDGMEQGDAMVSLVIDDLADYPGVPARQDQILIPDGSGDGATIGGNNVTFAGNPVTLANPAAIWTIQGVFNVYADVDLIGHDLHIRGGG